MASKEQVAEELHVVEDFEMELVYDLSERVHERVLDLDELAGLASILQQDKESRDEGNANRRSSGPMLAEQPNPTGVSLSGPTRGKDEDDTVQDAGASCSSCSTVLRNPAA